MLEQRRQALTAALEDSNPQVREAAAQALERLEPILHLAQVTAGLKSADRGDRIRALFALEGVRAPGVFDALLEMLGDRDADVRATAVQVLGNRAEAKALPELAKRLRDDSAAVRMYTAEALGAFRDPRLVPYLASVLQDGDSGVVEAAVVALGRLGAAEAEPHLLARLRDTRPEVRRAAAIGLGQIAIAEHPPT